MFKLPHAGTVRYSEDVMSYSGTRRQFLKAAALAPLLTLPLNGGYRPRVRGGKAKFSPTLNAYSFLEQLNENQKDSKKGIDLFGVVDFCVSNDVEAIDLTGYWFPGYPKSPDDGFINRMKRYVHERGMVISGTGVKNDFTTADKAARASGVALVKEWVEVAAHLGAPVLRVFAGPSGQAGDWKQTSGGATRNEVEKWMADDLRECALYGEKFGVIIAVQNHGDFLSTGAQHLDLLKRVDHEWCGALVDTGKYLTQDPYADIAMMVPHAVNWQIKETLGSTMNSPRADFRKLAQIIHDGGFRGFVPIETLSMGRKDYDPSVEVVRVLVAMRQSISSIRNA
jgi:sugar phosphate isomerase/epimerase